ncbi:MAG: hypothetical protein J3R72DRAFT_441807 [Linnemannia gamsii]|nr:MAG: hypothetical protein J3R72DRAFT_441807 [Linnemannia gamsii]
MGDKHIARVLFCPFLVSCCIDALWICPRHVVRPCLFVDECSLLSVNLTPHLFASFVHLYILPGVFLLPQCPLFVYIVEVCS